MRMMVSPLKSENAEATTCFLPKYSDARGEEEGDKVLHRLARQRITIYREKKSIEQRGEESYTITTTTK